MIATQVVIAVFGVSAVWLSQDKRESRRKWACVCGLMAQPAWFYETASQGQWLIFGLCLLYAYSWARGFDAHWVRPFLERRRTNEAERDSGQAKARPNQQKANPYDI